MIPKSVEYQRVVNLGNYENHRLRGFYELEEGETFEEGAKEAARQVLEQLDAIRAWEKAQEEAERKANEPWRVTPAMVADQPTLREKALRAAALVMEHRERDRAEEARVETLERFGIDAHFTAQPDGSAIAEVDGITLSYEHRRFTALVPVKGEAKPRELNYISTLEDLAIKLAQLDAWPGGEFAATATTAGTEDAVGFSPEGLGDPYERGDLVDPVDYCDDDEEDDEEEEEESDQVDFHY